MRSGFSKERERKLVKREFVGCRTSAKADSLLMKQLRRIVLDVISIKYDSNPDDNSEEDFNPGMIPSPVGIENAVLNPANVSDVDEDPDLQVDPSLNLQPFR